MENLKDKVISEFGKMPDINELHIQSGKKDVSIQEAVMDERESAPEQKNTDKNKAFHKKIKAASYTEADINWATVANKITIPNMVKGGMTIGGVGVGSVLGASLFTGLGFAMGGKGVAGIGYCLGGCLGAGAGAIIGHKFGKFVADTIVNGEQDNVVEKGNTKIYVDTMTEVNKIKN